jgi:hypothetical protein
VAVSKEDGMKIVLAMTLTLVGTMSAIPGARAADVKDVRVVNAPDEPVPVKGKVHIAPSRQVFQKDVSVEVPAGTLTAATTFAVPAGKRLVLEFVSGSTRVDVSELVRVNVLTTAGGDFVSHTVAPSVYRRELAAVAHQDFIVSFSQSLRLYADPDSTVTVTATRSENEEITPTFFALAVSGYLVDCGAAAGCPIP